MLKIRNTKDATLRQMQNMTQNLKEKLKTYVNVSIEARFFIHDKIQNLKYGIYIESDGKATHEFKTWKELQDYYHKLMGDV